MLVAFVTHPQAKGREEGIQPGGVQVRALSQKGKIEAIEAGKRLLSLLPPLLNKYGIEKVNVLASAPTTRCVETTVIVGEILSEITNVDEIFVTTQWKEHRIENKTIPITKTRVTAALRNFGQDSVVACLHADLPHVFANEKIPSSELDGDGWFKPRPVIAIVNLNPEQSIEDGELLVAEKYTEGKIRWENILKE